MTTYLRITLYLNLIHKNIKIVHKLTAIIIFLIIAQNDTSHSLHKVFPSYF